VLDVCDACVMRVCMVTYLPKPVNLGAPGQTYHERLSHAHEVLLDRLDGKYKAAVDG
jgi:hypothetical protein